MILSAKNSTQSKKHTHNVETDRIDDGEGIIKKTNAIDSNGYWLIDNWAALAGLTTYQYLCDEMHDKYGEELYQTESQWAQEEYDSLLAVVVKKHRKLCGIHMIIHIFLLI